MVAGPSVEHLFAGATVGIVAPVYLGIRVALPGTVAGTDRLQRCALCTFRWLLQVVPIVMRGALTLSPLPTSAWPLGALKAGLDIPWTCCFAEA